MSEPDNLHPFPAERIVRPLADRHPDTQAAPPAALGLTVLRADGVAVFYACEQDLHAASLVACRSLLQEREAHAVSQARAEAARQTATALAFLRHAHAAEVETRARRLARTYVHELVIRTALLASAAGVVAALATGVLELIR